MIDNVSKTKDQKGFTLIELLLVIGLMALAVGVTSDILLNLVRSYNKIQVFNEIEQQSNFVIQKMEKEIRNAVEAHLGGASWNDTNELLIKVGGEWISYKVTNDKLQRTYMGNTYDLTYGKDASNKPIIGGVLVSCGPSGCFNDLGDNPGRVKYELRFRQSQNTSVISESGELVIYNYLVLRRTY